MGLSESVICDKCTGRGELTEPDYNCGCECHGGPPHKEDHPDDLKARLAEVEADLEMALRTLKRCVDEKDGILKRSHRGGNATWPLELVYDGRAVIRMLEANSEGRAKRAIEWRAWREKNK